METIQQGMPLSHWDTCGKLKGELNVFFQDMDAWFLFCQMVHFRQNSFKSGLFEQN